MKSTFAVIVLTFLGSFAHATSAKTNECLVLMHKYVLAAEDAQAAFMRFTYVVQTSPFKSEKDKAAVESDKANEKRDKAGDVAYKCIDNLQ